jgi:hypothetical protein
LDLASGVTAEESVADMNLVADPTPDVRHPECVRGLALGDGTAHLSREEPVEVRENLVDLGLSCIAHAARSVRNVTGSGKLLARDCVATDTRSSILEK